MYNIYTKNKLFIVLITQLNHFSVLLCFVYIKQLLL